MNQSEHFLPQLLLPGCHQHDTGGWMVHMRITKFKCQCLSQCKRCKHQEAATLLKGINHSRLLSVPMSCIWGMLTTAQHLREGKNLSMSQQVKKNPVSCNTACMRAHAVVCVVYVHYVVGMCIVCMFACMCVRGIPRLTSGVLSSLST